MERRRVGAAAVVALIGSLAVVLTVPHVIHDDATVAARAITGFGAVVGVLLVGAAGWLYRSETGNRGVVRVAGWTLLGTVVMAGVIVLTALGIYAAGPLPDHADSFAAVIVVVSSLAHFLIGINDVKRIRAAELQREREKLSVLTRLVRHDLRNDAQVLIGFSERLATETEKPELKEYAEQVQTTAERVGRLQAGVREMQRLVDESPDPREVDLAALAEAAADDVKETRPDMTLNVEAAEPVRALAGERLESVLRILLGDVARRVGESPVDLAVRTRGDTAELRIESPELAVPDAEREVVLGDADVTALQHGSGVGLWMARWLTDAYGGTFDIEDGEATAVVLRFPAA